MTHIANCLRRGVEKISTAYIMEETQLAMLTQKNPVIDDIVSKKEKSPTRTIKQSPSRYQLWPRSKQQQETVHPATFGTFLITETEKANALSVGRSATSLSENAVALEADRSSSFWPRSGSLARRRKVSVPELKSTAQADSSSVSFDMDSPTIPGMPPLRRMISMDAVHSRSSSAPSHGRAAAPENVNSCIFATPPRRPVMARRPSQDNSMVLLPATTYNPTRPLSPIMSPVEVAMPKTALKIPSVENLPALDTPPQVPPKTPYFADLPPKTPAKNSPSRLTNKSSKPSLRPSPLPPVNTLTPPASANNSPSSRSEARMSPVELQGDMPCNPKDSISSFGSIMDRGRPRSKKNLTHQEAIVLDEFVMPAGFKPMEATLILPEQERETLRRQAQSQTEKFEVLAPVNVELLSKDLRVLDERCEYLRRTYKSLRAGRQKLHARMVAYLKSESISFSRERLLKQEEALIELDLSIDDWFEKLEQAENRRMCVRQKLLEHVAAAMALNSPYPPPPTRAAPTTPPPCHARRMPSLESVRMPRNEVQSIKVYADDGVLNLFTDIEQAVAKMCEAC